MHPTPSTERIKRSSMIPGGKYDCSVQWPAPCGIARIAFHIRCPARHRHGAGGRTCHRKRVRDRSAGRRHRGHGPQARGKRAIVPLAISAFSGAAIAARGVQKIDGLASFTPNMTLQNNPSFGGAGSSAAIYIRGIGQKEFLPTTEPGVGVYVDGVYVARSVGALLDLVDVERVEILRGPQGTLFGRNTIGGAISITTKKPDETPSGNLQVTTGRFSRIDVKASANIPLSDTLFSKVTVATFNRDGYVRHLVDGRELGDVGTLTGRFDLRWKPSSTFEVNLAVEGTRDRTNGPAFVLSGVTYKSAIFNPQNLPMLPPGSPATAGAYVLNPPFDAPTDNFTLLHNYFATLLGGQPCFAFAPYSPQGNAAACFSNRFIVGDGADAGTGPQYARNDLWGAQAVIDWDLGPVQLKSITAYRHVSGDYARDGDHSPFTILHLADILKQHQFSQELQVLGNTADDKLKYVVGLYYFNENGNNINNLDFTPVTFRSGGKFATKSYAAFGQATWTPIPLIDLTFGLRYTKDKKSFLPDQEILVDKTGGALIAASPNTPQTRVLPYVTAYRNEDAVTPSANVAFHVADNAGLCLVLQRVQERRFRPARVPAAGETFPSSAQKRPQPMKSASSRSCSTAA
jgi:iron complex outermembrane receptor protein